MRTKSKIRIKHFRFINAGATLLMIVWLKNTKCHATYW